VDSQEPPDAKTFAPESPAVRWTIHVAKLFYGSVRSLTFKRVRIMLTLAFHVASVIPAQALGPCAFAATEVQDSALVRLIRIRERDASAGHGGGKKRPRVDTLQRSINVWYGIPLLNSLALPLPAPVDVLISLVRCEHDKRAWDGWSESQMAPDRSSRTASPQMTSVYGGKSAMALAVSLATVVISERA